MICRGKQLRVELGRRQVVLQRRASLGGGAQLRRAGGGHAREPVEPLGVVGGQAGRTDRGQDPLGQQRGAGQRVRGPAGMAHDREPLNAQRVGDAGHVGGRRRHVPAWVGRGSAVAGPVVRHPADPALGGSWSTGSGGAPMLGVPWCQNTARQPSAPSAKASYACSVRPSLSNRSVCVTTRRAYLVLRLGSTWVYVPPDRCVVGG